MRAFLDARMRLLPDGFELPDDGEEIPPEQRDALRADFLTSPEGLRWHGDAAAEEVARIAIDFGAGYNHAARCAGALAVAALEAGVDLTDEADVERFIQRDNDGLAA